MEYRIGTVVFNDWVIVREIGKGATGCVFEIQKTGTDAEIRSALKVIQIPRSQSDVKAVMAEGMSWLSAISYFSDFVDEIRNEIRTMVLLKEHPNIVSYEDHCIIEHPDEIGWDILIKMELLMPMTDWMMENPMDEATVIRFGQEISSALGFAAAHRLIHRDVKPGNIFVDSMGNFKLGDFGIARVMDKTTGGLSRKGTEGYMPPEVYQGRADSKYMEQIDIYSLGMVLYRLLNQNRLPFYPPAPQPITYKDVESAVEQRMAGVPFPAPCMGSKELKWVVLKACAYDPKDRFSSMAEMYDALNAVNALPPCKESTPPKTSPQKPMEEKSVASPPGRNRKWIAAAVGGAVVIAALVAGLTAIKLKSSSNENKTEKAAQTVVTEAPTQSEVSEAASEPTPTTEEKTESHPSYYYATEKAKVYAEADTNSECLDELEDGQQISYYDNSTDGWLCIKYKNNQKAYVQKEYASTEAPEGRFFLNIPGYGSGFYTAGQKVEIEYDKDPGEQYYFQKWVCDIDGVLEDPYDEITEITMPSQDVSISMVSTEWKSVDIQTDSLQELLTDYTIKINGESYKLPMTYEEFEQKGWKVDAKDLLYGAGMAKNQNDSSEIKCFSRKGKDGKVNIVGLSIFKNQNTDLQIEFPGGIVFGKSTRADIKNVYGENSYDAFSGDAPNYLGYWREYSVGVDFGFTDAGQMETFNLSNNPSSY